MKEKEFNLSEKKWVGKSPYLVITDDIKEFINRLREDIIIPKGCKDKVGFVINTFRDRINKLAGDKLRC